MSKLIARRIVLTIPLLFIVTLIMFGLSQLVPGDPAVTLAGGENATPEQIEVIREEMGLDDPLLTQYWRLVKGIITFDLGNSLFSAQSVTGALGQTLPVTLSLAGLALVLVVLFGMAFGLAAGLRPGSLVDRSVTFVAALGVAAPSYWIAMILIIVFARELGWFPAALYVPFGEDPWRWLRHLALPAIALSTAGIVEVTRQLRSSLRETMHQDFVRTARAKGLSERSVVMKHALKNAAVPVITVIGLQVNFLLGGAIAVEQVAGLNGIGQLAVKSVRDRDVPMIQGIVLIAVLVVTLSNLIVDVLYGYLNPKVRAQ